MPLENPILPERDLLTLTAELVDIPSVSHDETAITDRIEQELRSLAHLEVTRIGNNLVARTQLGRHVPRRARRPHRHRARSTTTRTPVSTATRCGGSARPT